MSPFQFRSVVVCDDNNVDLAVADQHREVRTYRFTMDRGDRIPLMRCSKKYIDDHLTSVTRRAPDWPTDLALTAITARRYPLPVIIGPPDSHVNTAWPDPNLLLSGVFRRSANEVGVVAQDSRGGSTEWTFVDRRSEQYGLVWSETFASQYGDSALANPWPVALAELVFASDDDPLFGPRKLSLRWPSRKSSARS
ncbi:hypothetical protein [Nocardia sp. NPDC057668]|uniref:hypothetical protein n=1 Tax=Nocardia sp. NPDC057668 TaxID=3346202 RepID=UPI00366F28B5